MLEVPVLKRDQDWLVVDKPPGLSVHNVEDSENLIQLLTRQLTLENIFPVHRLDKETSGVQIFALTKTAAQKLSQEIQSDRVQKYYLGLLKGTLSEKAGCWNWPLTDKGEGRRSPQGGVKGRLPCATEYQVLRSNKYFSLCQFKLLTGRQHQIRKHTSLAKHPLVGDSRYGNPAFNQKVGQIYGSDRMLLHCSEMTIMGIKLQSQRPPQFDNFFKEVPEAND